MINKTITHSIANNNFKKEISINKADLKSLNNINSDIMHDPASGFEESENKNFNSNRNEEDNVIVNYEDISLSNIENSKEVKTKVLCFELLNFIEVFIHGILYLRKVYPQEAFQNLILYNLNLKFIHETKISEYINQFLEDIEPLLFNNILKRITLNIIDPENKQLLEYFTLNMEINEYYNSLNYEELCLNLKSALYKLYLDYANKQEAFADRNKSFNLCIETKDSKIFSSSNFKQYKEINKIVQDNFIIECFNNMSLDLLVNREVCCVLDHVNFNLTISRNVSQSN